MATSIASGLSKRGEHIRVMPNPPLSAAHFKCVANAYDPVKNPKGMVNLGSSENHLCYDLISEKFKDPKMHCIEPWMMQYCNTRGIIQLRQAIGDYLTMKNKTSTPVKPENLSVCNGVETLIAALMTVLCDPGDGFLCPAPIYGGVRNDLQRTAMVNFVPVHLSSQ
ncbi:1-aminocyclopropane-1-carboxylate synthase-like protein 1, partial [Saccoglossus kowalevskii]|uniref:1-aminocyclopropane-1-carboxylate synthase-like protein 1-like n=1 Tax=Saccoglossus kowalevskii TaxID=10224 RepID=A0ABM0N0W4_SACKO